MIKETEHFTINDLDKYFKKTRTRPKQYLHWLKRKTSNKLQFFCHTRHYRFGFGFYNEICFEKFERGNFTNIFFDSPLMLKGFEKIGVNASYLSSEIWNRQELKDEVIYILEEYIKEKREQNEL